MNKVSEEKNGNADGPDKVDKEPDIDVTTVDVDRIWIALGRYGPYQMFQCILLMLTFWSCGFHLLSFVFIAYRPTYECKRIPVNTSLQVSNKSEVKIEYNKCSTTTISNTSGVVTSEDSGCLSGWNYSYRNHEYFPTDRSFISEWDLVCDKEELTELSQTLLMLGQAFGAFIFTSMSDKLGRKPTQIGCHMSLFVITLATAFMPTFASFTVMRFITGAFQQGVALTATILNLEMYPMQIRSNVEVWGLLVWTTGIALITPLAYLFRNMSWRYLQICLSCMSAWSIIQWWLFDESLRWLIANGQFDKAKENIKKACRWNKKNYAEVLEVSGFRQFEMRELQIRMKNETMSKETEAETLVENENHDVKKEQAIREPIKKYTVIDLIKSRRLFISSAIMWFTWTTNSATYYGIMLLSSSLAGNRFLNFFLGSVVEYPAALMEYAMFNRFGRKPACIVFHAICCVSLLMATILTTTANGSEAMLLGSTVFTLIGKFAITGSFSTIFLYTPELYPTNMRNLGIGMSSAASRVGAMLAPFSRNLAETHIWAPGLIFCIMSAIVVVLMFWVPETNQRELPQTLAETEIWYKDNRFRMPGTKKSRNGDVKQ